ncbi:heterokaryon incompatibility protein [Fusarium austroafricanum]|uniref:Heterokaryon incompatibility protein n=1 Tax=Fusarium austroafricanum TaxID=2364996 RepID=A0A8H4K1B0_9HYPO|nr:heterokaryon incompatibility protein [Fusarium austroafricanum]
MKPTRLLRYDQERGKVLLCTSAPSDASYAALSHCWGSVQPLTLNSSTKHQLEEGLPLEAFPQTFKDAFWLIQQLKIPYIWIDSLCIVQDDNDDWVHESARMCDVYGNAYLTIAAMRASNCSEGFLGPIEGPEYTYIPFNQDGIDGNISIFPLPLSRVGPWSGIVDLEEEPLSKRAWALQERYLSPRTLHFACTQMYFECRSDFHAQDHHFKHKDTEPDFKIHRRVTAKDNEKPTDAWRNIVRRYTERYLTVESDKLPAIAGLAARVLFERSLRDGPTDEYLAGLWRDNLLSDLIWNIDDQSKTRGDSTSYTAPTWSWASVSHPVFFLAEVIQNLALVKDAKVDLESPENPFGRVTGGWVHLSSIKIHPDEVEDDGDLYFREGDARFRVSPIMDSSRFNLPAVRLVDYVNKKSELVAVPLTLHSELVEPEYEDDDPVAGAYFLILISSTSRQGPIDGLPCYRRIGLGISWKERMDGNDVDARRRLRDRCLEAMEQGTLEDIIIV